MIESQLIWTAVGLSNEFMLPLRTFGSFEIDPLIAVTASLSDLREDELAVFQVLFQPVRAAWRESILASVTDGSGKSFFVDLPQMASLAKDKVSRPLYAAVLRLAAQSPTHGRAWQITKAMGSALVQLADPHANELTPLSNDDYPNDEHESDLLDRQTHRSGMILNVDELVGLVHFPSASVRSEKLERRRRRTRAAPAISSGHPLVLGENHHAGRTEVVSLNADQRSRHTYLVGASGTGKSTLLLNLIIQDIQQGQGVGVLDPHGDLIDQILGYIPEKRHKDVILFDPSDAEHPIGFNILSAHSELEKTLLSSDLGDVFRRLSTSWGDQMTSVLANAILALLESEQGGTLLDLRRFLVEKDFRSSFLETVQDDEVIYYWRKEFPLLSGRPQAPLLTRLDTFLRSKLIRNMVCQKENRLDFKAIQDHGKIFLAKLAQGAIGEENSYLLGTLLVSKIHQMATARQEMAESERRPFYLYIDEFQNFLTPSMAGILSGARKYHLALTLAHQELRQLWNKNTDVASAVISNPYTRICFRLGDFDAQKLRDGFSYFEAQDLQNLGIGEAVCRIERAEYDFNLRTYPMAEIDVKLAVQRRNRIVEFSRGKYSRPRREVEKELRGQRPATSPERSSEPGRNRPKTTPAEETVAQQEVRPQAPVPESPLLKGRGGGEHKHLQQLIQRWAKGRGYQATIEMKILDGLGSVDVALEKDGFSVVCEISVTSTTDQEVKNIQKCLAAGFDHAVLVSSDKSVLSKVRGAVAMALGKEQFKQVGFFVPEALFNFLMTLEAKTGVQRDRDLDSKDLLTAKEVAKMLSISVKTVYSYAHRGLMPYVRIQSNVR